MWDERYRGDDYVYGTYANDFLRSQIDRLPRGRIPCLTEGEGHNAVFLAGHGFDVREVVRGLRPGDVFVLEAYRPEQLQYRTGEPSSPEMMMNLDGLRSELGGLEFEYAAEAVRDIHEGKLHDGPGVVVQVRARKPDRAG